MSIIKKIFSTGATDLVNSVGNTIDKLHTSAEEKELAKREMTKLINDYKKNIEEQVTSRWQSDNNQDSWLPRNIRPLVLAWLVVSTTLLIFIDAGAIKFVVADKWVSLLEIVLITCIGAYFGSRGLEKIKKNAK